MADFSMWGPAESGFRLAEQDAATAMIRAAQAEHQKALARTENAQAAMRENELEGEKRMAEAMARAGQNGVNLGGQTPVNNSLASPLEQMAQLSYQSGLPAKGAKLAEQAALIRAREASARERDAQTERFKLEADHQALTHASRLFGNVTDQASLDRANALYASVFGVPSPIAGAPYTPELVRQVQDYSSTQLERLRGKMLEIDTASKVANRNSAIGLREFRKGIMGQELDLKAQREERLGKVGGKEKGPTSPIPRETNAALRLLTSEYPDLPKDELDLAADKVASRAKGIMASNKALDYNAALRQAVAEAKPDFQTVEKSYKVFGIGPTTKTTTFKPGAPLPLPTSKNDLKVGQTYQTAKGPLTWNGQRLVPQPAARAPATPPPDESDVGGETEED